MTGTVTRDDAIDSSMDLSPEPSMRKALSAAQRQRACRMRCKRAVTQAIGDEAQASRVTLVALLDNSLASLDDKPRESMRAAYLNCARRVTRMLVTRYGIDLADD